ncbi:MAG: hypothetical protein N2C14_34165 [Planctomycetales bacterium]
MFGLLWVTVTCCCCLVVFQETANGVEEIENWPNSMWVDWIAECFYVVNGVGMSVLPGVAAASMLGFSSVVYGMALAASAFLFFPIAFVSLTDAGSVLIPFSPDVLVGAMRRPHVWVLFYLETALLGFVFGGAFLCGLGLAAYLEFSLLFLLAVSVPTAITIQGLTLVYFRLLGRVAHLASVGAN